MVPALVDVARRARRSLRLMSLAAWRGVGELYNSDGLTHAASIAYYALLSFFPFLLLVLSVLGSLTADAADARRRRAIRLPLLSSPVRLHDRAARRVPRSDGSTGCRRLLALTWASLGVFNAVSSAVNHAWGVEKRRSFLMHRLVSFLMMVSAGAIFVIALVLASIVRAGRDALVLRTRGASRWSMAWLSAVSAELLAPRSC